MNDIRKNKKRYREYWFKHHCLYHDFAEELLSYQRSKERQMDDEEKKEETDEESC